MSFLEPIALFLSVWRYVHGPGAEIKFVGTSATYRHTNTDSSQDTIARSEIYLSVSAPAEADGEAFNTADYTVPNSWVDRWPAMVSYFGLKGTPPDEPAEGKLFRCFFTPKPSNPSGCMEAIFTIHSQQTLF